MTNEEIKQEIMERINEIEMYDPKKHLCWVDFVDDNCSPDRARLIVNKIAKSKHLHHIYVRHPENHHVYGAYELPDQVV